MPYQSQAQAGWMHTNKPKLAKEFDKATPKGTKLPEKVKPKPKPPEKKKK